MLGKPRILSLFLNRLINSIEHELSYKIFYITGWLGHIAIKININLQPHLLTMSRADWCCQSILWQWYLSIYLRFNSGHINYTDSSPTICYNMHSNQCSVLYLSDCTIIIRVRKRAKIRNRYNQVPHLTQDTNGKVTDSQLDITNESQEVSPFTAGDHKASINRRTRKHN